MKVKSYAVNAYNYRGIECFLNKLIHNIQTILLFMLYLGTYFMKRNCLYKKVINIFRCEYYIICNTRIKITLNKL